MALRMMVTEHRSFAEAAVFIGYRLPDPESNVDLDQLRTRLAKMNDVELRQFGRSAAYMCSPGANLGAEPRPVFVLQLDEARAEWRRRHP